MLHGESSPGRALRRLLYTFQAIIQAAETLPQIIKPLVSRKLC